MNPRERSVAAAKNDEGASLIRFISLRQYRPEKQNAPWPQADETVADEVVQLGFVALDPMQSVRCPIADAGIFADQIDPKIVSA